MRVIQDETVASCREVTICRISKNVSGIGRIVPKETKCCRRQMPLRMSIGETPKRIKMSKILNQLQTENNYSLQRYSKEVIF